MGKGLIPHTARTISYTSQIEIFTIGSPQLLYRVQGVRFSGGQRQRLAVARMILGQPKLVILDEASSALDTETEAKLHGALAGYLQGRTCLIIAHRLSSIRQADRVYVFDGGRIVEHGHHDDLIEQDGLYQCLYGDAKA